MQVNRLHFQIISSTNTWSKEHADEFDPKKLTLVTAYQQTAGRGRFKRVWISPPGSNIYATFCFFTGIDLAQIGYIPQLLALSTCECLETYHFKPTLKWPNDVLLSGKKVAGILCETTPSQGLLCVVCGIGVNINMPLEELLKIDRPATSLLVESGVEFEVETVLSAIQEQFNRNLQVFLEHGFQSFFAEYEKRSHFTKGQRIRFHDNLKVVEGTFHCLNVDGSLTLQLHDGQLHTYYAGEFV